MSYLIKWTLEAIRKQFLGKLCQVSGLNIKYCKSMEVFIFNYQQNNEKGMLQCDFGTIDVNTLKIPNGTIQLEKEERELPDIQKKYILEKREKEFREEIGKIITGAIEELDDEDRKRFTDMIPKFETEVKKQTNGKEVKIFNTDEPIINISCFANFEQWYFVLNYETKSGIEADKNAGGSFPTEIFITEPGKEMKKRVTETN